MEAKIFAETRAFLDRRSKRLCSFEKVKAKVTAGLGDRFSMARFCRPFALSGKPGTWHSAATGRALLSAPEHNLTKRTRQGLINIDNQSQLRRAALRYMQNPQP